MSEDWWNKKIKEFEGCFTLEVVDGLNLVRDCKQQRDKELAEIKEKLKQELLIDAHHHTDWLNEMFDRVFKQAGVEVKDA